VELAEIEKLVEELESRVERLRALYEQYFMGIERIEPLILRKDVDRRLWVLWREQIRNTGLRFRLHMTIQRYNTYQQYWMRICREMEDGTYHRDVRRAAARFGDAALTAMGRRRKKMFEKGLAKKAERDAARKKTDQTADPAPKPPSVAPAASSAPAPPRPAIALNLPARKPPARRIEAGAVGPLELDVLSDFADEGAALRAAPVPSFESGRAASPVVAAEKPAPRPAVAPEAPPEAPADRSDEEIEPATLRPPPPQQAPARPKPLPGARPQPAPAAAAVDDLTPARLRQIYGQYVEARRRCNESTASLTFDKVSRDLRETAQKLRQKHAGKTIDFEVVLRNGKPVLRPVVKS
jgi:hypothetical protein